MASFSAREAVYQIHFCLFVLTTLLFVQERARPFNGRHQWILNLNTTLADKIQMNYYQKHQRYLTTSELATIKKINALERKKINNRLHCSEVTSVILLSLMVWAAGYMQFHKCSSNQDWWCSSLGFIVMSSNVIYLILVMSMFGKAWSKTQAKHIRKCIKVFHKIGCKCCCIVNEETENDDIIQTLKELKRINSVKILKEVKWNTPINNPMQRNGLGENEEAEMVSIEIELTGRHWYRTRGHANGRGRGGRRGGRRGRGSRGGRGSRRGFRGGRRGKKKRRK